jgi:hypothetical protein
MFNTVIDQVKAVRGEKEVVIVKLGTVTALSGGKAQVKLYGDDTASTKLYQYIDGYLPQVNDKVALLPQGKTYIILGKITDAAPVEKYATKDYVDETFLPLEYKNKLEDGNNSLTLSGTNLLPGSNNSMKLGASDKQFSSIYGQYFYDNGERLRADGIVITYNGTAYNLLAIASTVDVTLTPSVDDKWNLGSSARKFKSAYLGLFRGSWKSGNSTERQVAWNSSNALAPDSNEAVDLGTSSLHFKDAYFRRMIGTLAYSSTSGTIGWASATVLQPSANNSIDLGSSGKQFNKIYAKESYVNGTAVTSDRSLKKDIKELEEKHLAFFRCLRPVQFKYKDGESGRTHTGFIAQEVEDAIHEAGMTNQDMAVVVIDQESGRHYLRYEELIAVQTEVIQNMQKKVDSLEARLAKLEALLERSTK